VSDMESVLCLLVRAARSASAHGGWADPWTDPLDGDLVVEISWLREPDPDAIGWLIGHDQAPYFSDAPLDGSVPMREVWDVLPLNPGAKLRTIDGQQLQRWENARFVGLPESWHAAAEKIRPKPSSLRVERSGT
jgi:hypothetical protein